MNVFAKFDEIPSMILQDIKETKRNGHTDDRKDGRTDGWTDGQCENSIPSHKHSLRGYNYWYLKSLISKLYWCVGDHMD